MASDEKLLSRMQQVLSHLADTLDLPVTIILWDGSESSLRKDKSSNDILLTIKDKGVISSLLKHPNIENITRHYAIGNITIAGDNFIDMGKAIRSNLKKKDIKKLNKTLIVKKLAPFLLNKSLKAGSEHEFGENESGHNNKKRNNKDYIQFHYDVSNDFYKLFLDDEMQYSCGYFTDWDNSLEQAQIDKLDMICKKLRLKEGERYLDIGCGWGGLICHAAKNYNVKAHGITLSQEQYNFATAKVKRLGLEDKITIEIRDYITLEGEYDKISSIGMFEHIGIDNFPDYFNKVNSLLRPRGVFLNHGIARRAKSSKKKRNNITAEKQLLLKYIFPGSELAPIGFSLNSMEKNGFEVHDVEAWREHYSITCEHWCKRLSDNKEEAIKQVGLERYNLWIAYLAGVAFGFNAGSMLIFQTLATKRGKEKGFSQMPPTRADLYNI